MRNNNASAVRRLSMRSLKNNRTRNIFAVLAISLTCMLFTAVFSMVQGMAQVSQESTMHEVGSRSHAGLKAVTVQQYEQISKDPLIKRSYYNIFIGYAENILKRNAEIRYLPSEENLADYFITIKEGSFPAAEDEILVDTFVMDELQIPHRTGEQITLEIPFMGETVEKTFTVSGWYEGDSISHASELFVSEAFWNELRGDRTDEDFKQWAEIHPEDSSVGLISADIYFANSSNIEENIRAVIENAGYEPETEVDYGVNWAYMSNRMESVDPLSLAMVIAALGVILLTGYLIIYNIFQISVMNDIRFYGLLKTIGTTKRQLRSLIMRQALVLSLIGIPIGLVLGYGIGKAGLPVLMSFLEYGNMEISLKFHPAIFLFGAAFSAFTVFLSCRKPGKIAGRVSPVEAVKYTDRQTSVKPKKKRSKPRRFSLFSMACANLGRSKKKTAVVVAAVSLSMILLTLVLTGVGSFRLDQYLEQRIAGDVMIGCVDIFSTISRCDSDEIDPEYTAFARSQEGILEENEMWVSYGKFIQLNEDRQTYLQELKEEGLLNVDLYSEASLEDILNGSGLMSVGYTYAYSDPLLNNLTVLEGSLDIDRFQSGDYILLCPFYGNEVLDVSKNLYHPGDKIVVGTVTEESTAEVITDENGDTTDVRYDNLAQKEYEVMAIVDMPYSLGLNRFFPNSMDIILPLREINDETDESNVCFARSYQIKEESLDAFEAAIKSYTENVNPYMGYSSKKSLSEEFQGMTNAITMIGVLLAAVIALIGILNFINAVFTGILSRKQEFAMLQSVGMTNAQLKKMLVLEGVSYILFAAVISFFAGSLLSYGVLSALNKIILFFEYRFSILPFVIMIPILLAAAVITPLISFRQLQKKSIVERLRETE